MKTRRTAVIYFPIPKVRKTNLVHVYKRKITPGVKDMPKRKAMQKQQHFLSAFDLKAPQKTNFYKKNVCTVKPVGVLISRWCDPPSLHRKLCSLTCDTGSKIMPASTRWTVINYPLSPLCGY